MDQKNITLKNGAELIIRRAMPEDAAEYTELVDRCYGETRFLSRCTEDVQHILDSPEEFEKDVEDTRKFIMELQDSQKEEMFVALCDGHVVGDGCITACLNKKKMLHRCDLDVCISKAYWGNGIGRALMQTLMDFAQSAGYEQVDLVVADDNERAICLYEKCGFQDTGRMFRAMKHADGDYSDFVCMTKLLIRQISGNNMRPPLLHLRKRRFCRKR